MAISGTVAKLAATTLVVICLGAGSAAAASWGELKASHDGKVQGKGKGNIVSIGAQTIELKSQLADMHADGTRTYAQANYYNGSSFGQMQSGRRSDGGSSYANMKNKYATSVEGDAASYWAYVKVCQDVNLAPDWCSARSSKKDL